MNRSEIIRNLHDFKENHARGYGILLMGIFGSVVRGDASETSDVDVVVKTETPDPFAIVHMKEQLEKQLQQRVDIVRMRESMNPSLRRRIEAEAVYV